MRDPFSLMCAALALRELLRGEHHTLAGFRRAKEIPRPDTRFFEPAVPIQTATVSSEFRHWPLVKRAFASR